MYRIWDKSKPPNGPFALNRDAPQARGLVSWYPMGGANGKGLAYDLAGHKHLTGTANGVTLGNDGRPMQTFVAASSQFLSSTSVPTSAFPLTIAAWARPATVHNGSIAGLGRNAAGLGPGRKLIYAHSAGNIRAYSENDSATGVFPVSAGSYTAGEWLHACGVFASSTSTSAYRNGANKTTLTTAVTFGTPDKTRIADDNTASNYFDGDVGETGFWNVALDDSLVWRLYDPGTRYELWYPLRSRKWMVSAGGGSYSAAITESAAAADAATAAYIATASVSESITAADSLAAATTWVRSLTEAASTADALASAVTWARALTEAASASDLATAIRHAVAALTEAASASDSQATGSIYAGSLTEAASVSDALTAAATLVALLTEVATASDAATSAATWVRLLTEPATAVDSVAGAQGATYTASVTEVLAATELLVAVLGEAGVALLARYTITAAPRRTTITAARRRLEITR